MSGVGVRYLRGDCHLNHSFRYGGRLDGCIQKLLLPFFLNLVHDSIEGFLRHHKALVRRCDDGLPDHFVHSLKLRVALSV